MMTQQKTWKMERPKQIRKLKTVEMQRLSVEEFKQTEKLPLVVVLDDVRSLYNVGSVFRTSDAFKVEAVYLCGITAKPPSAEIHKTALGAEESVEWTYCQSTAEAVDELHSKGYKIYSVEQVHGSTSLQQMAVDNSTKYAIILGNEVKGVGQEVVDASDGCIELPQCGTKHSLNVANTAAIVMWHFFNYLYLDNNQ